MTQSAARSNNNDRQPLPGLPDGPLSQAQHLDAIRRVQDQADQRVQLGTQLFKAAQAHTHHYKQLLGDIKNEQQSLREQVDADVTNTLQSYDQWIGDIDKGFGDAMAQLEDKISRLQNDWEKTQQRIETMMDRSQQMLKQSQSAIARTEQALEQQSQAAADQVHNAAAEAKQSVDFVINSHAAEDILARVQPIEAAPAPEAVPAETEKQVMPEAPQPDTDDDECGEGVTDARAVRHPHPIAPDDDDCGEGITDAKADRHPHPIAPDDGDCGEGITDASTAKQLETKEPSVKIYSHLLDQLLNQYDKTAGD